MLSEQKFKKIGHSLTYIFIAYNHDDNIIFPFLFLVIRKTLTYHRHLYGKVPLTRPRALSAFHLYLLSALPKVPNIIQPPEYN